jgi:cytoskeleton protein RodZ
MTPVGETLRRERIKRNLELDTISSELKISSRFLQAIESDQFDKLPGGVFAKSFVRQYAHLLGLDEEEMAVQVERTLAPAVPLGGDRPKPGGKVPIQVPKVEEWETVGDRGFRGGGLLSVAAFVAVMLVCSAVYSWLQRPKSPPAVAQAPAQSAPAQSTPAPITPPVAQPAVIPPPEPQPAAIPDAAPAAATRAATPAASSATPADAQPADAPPAENKLPESKAAASKPGPVAPSVPPTAKSTVHVEITAEEPVWVLVRTDGKYAFSATMDAHSTRSVDAVKDVVLRLGNAGGVTISLNGKAIGPAGPKGQVRTIQFTSGGFHIVPAKPSADPLDFAWPL